MANSFIVAETFIIPPETHHLILATAHKVLSLPGNSQGINLTLLAAIEHTYRLSIKRRPVSDLLIAPRRQELALLRVIHHRLLEIRFLHRVDPGEALEIPYNPGAVRGDRNRVLVIGLDLDVVDFLLVLLERVDHGLGELADAPDPYLSFLATGDDPGAVAGAGHGGDPVDMGVVDDVHLLPGLGVESTDLAIAPAGDDALAVPHEADGVALAVGIVDTEELCAVLGVPDTDVIKGASSKHIRVHTITK